jgi:hypothetical protein
MFGQSPYLPPGARSGEPYEHDDAFNEGCEAREDGLSLHDNPYPWDHQEFDYWTSGWNTANEESLSGCSKTQKCGD